MRDSVLKIAETLINGQRSKDYGDPTNLCEKVAAFWTTILQVPVTAVQVNMCMITLKLAREMNKHKEDNLVDIAGYVEILSQVIHEQNKELFGESRGVIDKYGQLSGVKCLDCGAEGLPEITPEGKHCQNCGARLY